MRFNFNKEFEPGKASFIPEAIPVGIDALRADVLKSVLHSEIPHPEAAALLRGIADCFAAMIPAAKKGWFPVDACDCVECVRWRTPAANSAAAPLKPTPDALRLAAITYVATVRGARDEWVMTTDAFQALAATVDGA